jgi:hypothetical protein
MLEPMKVRGVDGLSAFNAFMRAAETGSFTDAGR